MSEELLIAAAAATTESRTNGKSAVPHETCTNCGAALAGAYCHACGQKRAHLHKPIWELTEDFFHSVLHFDGRLWATLRALFLKPGQLTLDWIDGRQVRHVPPIRLFIFTTLILVLLLALSDVALVRLDGHLVATANANAERQGFTIGNCTDENSSDCIKGKSKRRMDFDGNLKADLFRLTPKTHSAQPAITANITAEIDNPRGRKVADTLLGFVNAAAADPKILNKAITGSLTTFVLLATPIMALLLKLIYVRRKKFLAEHVFFALHVHTLFVAALIISVLLVWISRGALGGWWMLAGLWLAYSVYFLLAMKRAYAQGWTKTIFKSAFVTGFYIIALFTIGTWLLSRTLIHAAG